MQLVTDPVNCLFSHTISSNMEPVCGKMWGQINVRLRFEPWVSAKPFIKPMMTIYSKSKKGNSGCHLTAQFH